MSAARAPRDLAASIRQRLLGLARGRGEDFQWLLDRYAVERMLYRLSVSDQRDDFLLKGALLFAVWFDAPHRPTRDADFLGFGEPDVARLADSVGRLCAISADDGMAYDAASIQVQEIREQAPYAGLRVNLRAALGNARCNVQLDVGFGDAVTPAPVEVEYPGLLAGLPAPRLHVYPRESVYAEKLEAIVQLGIANSRMKDYFDLLVLAGKRADLDTMVQMIAYARTNRSKLNYGSPGTGTVHHLAMELFSGAAGIEMTHVPYKGSGPALQDLIGGNIDVMPGAEPSAKGHVSGGRIRALAVFARERLPGMPSVPTAREAGVPFEESFWWGFMVPGKVPADVTQAIAEAAVAAVRDPNVGRRMVESGVVAVGSSPEEFEKFFLAQYEKWGKIASSMKLKVK